MPGKEPWLDFSRASGEHNSSCSPCNHRRSFSRQKTEILGKHLTARFRPLAASGSRQNGGRKKRCEKNGANPSGSGEMAL